MRRLIPLALIMVAAIVIAAPADAQPPMFETPRVSQAASITQRVGLTDITITYHRPGVKERDIWGALVPYDQVWRAGANENTTITFTDPVMIEGKALAAGTYGLHMIPTKSTWTVIFNRQSQAWGSFAYKQNEDALRVTVTPVSGEHQEWLVYTFDNPAPTSVVATLRWEKLRVAFKIEVNTNEVVVAHINDALTGLPQFFWNGWQQAARWCLNNNTNLEQAQVWADEAIRRQSNFSTMQLKVDILAKQGKDAEAAELHEQAVAIATETELNQYGYQLMGIGEVDRAIAMFEKNAQAHPDSWNTHDSLAEAYASKGDKKKALEQYKKALELVQDDTQKARIQGTIASLEG